ncbi:MAG: hypothetical protein BJ554DRAFT_7615, partial [Olpidium bornovanus]
MLATSVRRLAVASGRPAARFPLVSPVSNLVTWSRIWSAGPPLFNAGHAPTPGPLTPPWAHFPRLACLLRVGAFRRGYASASSTLLVVEHKDNSLNPATLSAVTAAKALGSGVTALVAGSNVDNVVKQIARTDGVEKVIVAKKAEYDHGLPEDFAPLVVAAVKSLGSSHVVAAHTAFGKNVLPRAAALLDVQGISDVTAVESADTFVRPIYAGPSPVP